jgi:hypothetical protein
MKFLLRKEFFACVTRYGGERYVRSFSPSSAVTDFEMSDSR